MVKYSGRVRLNSGVGSKKLGYVGKGCNGTTNSKTGDQHDCKNKIYEARRGGKKGRGLAKNYCKKHFQLACPVDWTPESKDNRWFIYPKDHFKKKTIPNCEKSGCYSIAFNEKNGILFCKFHYERA